MWLLVITATLTGCLTVDADDVPELYRKTGAQVVLKPDLASVTGAIKSIMWKHGSDIAVQLEGSDFVAFRQFKERGTLNNTTGELTITGLTPEDGGVYTPEINHITFSPTRLFVISSVPVPTVSASCDAEKTRCTLTCEGDVAGAEPVSYTWNLSDSSKTDSTKDYIVTKEESAGTISCTLKNPVSQESSQPIPSPFSPSESSESEGGLKINVGLTVFICLLMVLLVLVLVHRFTSGMWFYQKGSMPWEADFWRKQERQHADPELSSSAAAQEKAQEDEAAQMM
ncbi:uncharacterized protein ACBR49_019585 [Aulostomus maculatus]